MKKDGVKSIGVVRKVDRLGRVVLPAELRETMQLNTGTPLEIYIYGERIILKKYAPGCYLCGEIGQSLQTVMSKPICGKCVAAVCRQAGC